MGGRCRGAGGTAASVRSALLVGSVLLAAACGEPDPASEAPSASGVARPDDRVVAPDDPAAGPAEVAVVVEVVDGDTLVVRLAGDEERVRLIGVNAPERGECFADEATAALRSLVDDGAGEVRLVADVSDRDQYDRLLRYVFLDEVLVNAELVAEGVARSRAYPPDTARQAQLDRAEQEARGAGRGLWADGACGTAAPGDVAIVDAVADPPGADAEDPNAETVTVANQGSQPADLSGWVLKDTSASHRYRFPDGFVLAPGAEVVVRTGCGTDTATDLHWCNQGSLVWNNSGDTAYLEDPAGNTVSVLDV